MCALTYGVDRYTVVTERTLGADWQMQPHHHGQHEIALVRAGACRMFTERQEQRFIEGQAFFIPGGVGHGFRADSPAGVAFAIVQFPDMEASLVEALVTSGPVGRFTLLAVEDRQFADLCFELQKEVVGALPGCEIVCRSLVNQMAVLMLRSRWRTNARSLSLGQQALMEKALRWMHQHFEEDVRIKDVAAHVALSQAHFRQLFRRYVGVGPKRYLTNLRIQSSKSLLMHSDQTITEIAASSGFSSPQQFSKVFRHHTGLVPSKWRQAHLNPLRRDPSGPDWNVSASRGGEPHG